MKNFNIYILFTALSIIGLSIYYFICIQSKQTEFNFEFENKKAKYNNPDKFYEYHAAIRTGANEEKPSYPFNYRYTEIQKAKKTAKKSVNKNIVWTERGPGNVPGRTRTIIIDPDDPVKNTWYAGSVGGGIWKTINAGESWENMTPDLANLVISTMEMAASNHNVIYAGTGEMGFISQYYEIGGSGIFKSNDRGLTWSLLESTNNNNFQSVTRLIVDPEDDNIVIASTYTDLNTNIVRTNDGGESWDIVHSIVHKNITQVIATPGNFDVLFAAVYGSGVLKSVDRGLSWNLVSNGFSGHMRIELAIAKNNTDIIYASVDGAGNKSDLYISLDAGENWDLVEEAQGDPPNWLENQGGFDNTITVNPFEDHIVYVGGIKLWKIIIEGIEVGILNDIVKTTQLMSIANNVVHDDQHYINSIIGEEENEFRLIVGNDGGIYYSNYGIDPGFTVGVWTMAGMTYNTSQFYGLDKYPGENIYIGGTQDNGTWRSTLDANANSYWEHINGGDGFECIVNYNDPLKIIVSSQYNYFVRTIDGGQNVENATTGLIGNSPFISRLAGSKSDPELIYTVTSEGVGRTDNFAEDWVMTYPNGNWIYNPFSIDITVSIANPQIVWAGAYMLNDYHIFVSTNGGNTFEETNNFKNIGMVTGLETHPLNENEAFALFSINNEAKIIRTYDLGQNWEDISGFDESSQSTGFPNAAVYSLLVMPYDTSVIWAGTDIGLFESTNNGLSWAYIDNGLPAVTIWQMGIVNDQIIFGTHGRGIWSATVPELEGYEPPKVVLAPIVRRLTQVPANNIYPKVEAEIYLRESYDSTRVCFNNKYHSTIEGNTTENILIETFSIVNVDNNYSNNLKIYLIAFKDGKEFYSGNRSIDDVVQFLQSHNEYETDFENALEDFSMDGLTIQESTGFDGKAIHSQHNYIDLEDGSIVLRYPIIVKESNAFLEYKDIALVQPGESGSVYGEIAFLDYVVIEASTDGVNWISLEDGYDARYDADWSSAYSNGNIGTPDLFVEHFIDLHDNFSAMDTIAIRFRLNDFGSPYSWGWVIDDLKIQTTGLKINKVSSNRNLIKVFPNPGGGIFNIEINDLFGIIQSIEVYNNSGRLVKAFDEYSSSIDLTDQNPGIYYLRISNETDYISRKVQIIK
ncbi:MAG: T9SS type A sorting domain-containing protein [Bacteroidales bacterium]|nr:T9SS type A sorting domain-containing protein [Bacteroidales bacterium]